MSNTQRIEDEYYIYNLLTNHLYGHYSTKEEALQEAVKRNAKDSAHPLFRLYVATRKKCIVPIGILSRSFGTNVFIWRLYSHDKCSEKEMSTV